MAKTYKLLLYHPHDGQVPMHKSNARFRVATCGRRFGKSFMALNEIVKHAWENPDHLCWWTAPTYKQCANVFEMIKKHFKGAIESTRTSPNMEVRLVNGGVIQFHSLERYDNLRGFAVNFLVVDEAADVREEAWNAVLRPTLSDTNGKAIIISTPKGKNWFYEMWTRGRDPEFPDYESWRFPTSANPYIPPGEVEEAERGLPERIFRQEYLAEFLDDDSSVFRGIKKCIAGDFEEPKPGRKYRIGWDVAKHHDYSVIVVMDEETKHVVAFDRFNHVDWDLQVSRCETLAKKYNNAPVLIDSTGVGDPVFEMLKKRGVKVEGFRFTSTSKEQLINRLSVAIERQEITFPEIEVLIDELGKYEFEVTKSGTIRYNAPDGQHDDCVIALALAVWNTFNHVPLQIFI